MDLDTILERALSLSDDGDWMGSAEVLREHLDAYAEEPALHCWLAVAERELGNEGAAYELFKRTLALEPRDPYLLATAGNGVSSFDDPDAMEALKTAALIAPDVPLARLLYGAYLAREGFPDQALEQLHAARELDGDDPQIVFELGVAHALGGDIEAAADVVGDAVALDPNDGWARTVFGLLLLELDRLEEAVGELAEAARLQPEDVEAQMLAALACGSTGVDSTAYEMVERARMRALEGDAGLISAIEDRIDEGPDESRRLLMETLAPDALRSRLQQRP